MKKALTHRSIQILAFLFLIFMQLTALAQNVADSDLSNNAGTNKNFREQWWLYAVIALVLVAFIVGYIRRRGRKVG